MSVRKRTWQTAAGEAKQAWVVDYRDQAGRRHVKTFDRKRDADAAEKTIGVDVIHGTHTADSDSVTVAEAAELWLKTCEGNDLEQSTLAQYRQHVTYHISPFIGTTKLPALSAPTVRAFCDALRAGRPSLGEKLGKPRSPAMVKKVRSSLGSLLADAQENGLVARNVVRELRSKQKRGQERRAEKRAKGKLRVGIDIPTPGEMTAVLRASEGRWRPFLLTATFTGMRASELRGLRWCDVDLKRKVVQVRQRADRYKTIGQPKSEAGERVIPIGRQVVDSLREWKLACPPNTGNLVFPTREGGIQYHSNAVRRALWPAQMRAGVTVPVVKDGRPLLDAKDRPVLAPKYTGLHALRHFYASLCINREEDGGLGLPPKVVQARLGHSTMQMTYDVYGHLFPTGDDGSEMDAAESALLA